MSGESDLRFHNGRCISHVGGALDVYVQLSLACDDSTAAPLPLAVIGAARLQRITPPPLPRQFVLMPRLDRRYLCTQRALHAGHSSTREKFRACSNGAKGFADK